MRYGLSVVAVWFFAIVAAHAQLTVFLTPSVASPSPVGTVITWTASVAGASGNTQYRSRADAGPAIGRTPHPLVSYGAGWLPDNTSNSVDVDSSGNLVGVANVKNPEYRSFQMKDLYTLDSELPRGGREIPSGRGLYFPLREPGQAEFR